MRKINVKTKRMMLLIALLLMNVWHIQSANSYYYDNDDPWQGSDKSLKIGIMASLHSSYICVSNATSEEDITASIIDADGLTVHSEVIAAEDTSYFTIYVGNLSTGTYQLVLSIDGVDYLFWPFAI